MSSPREQYVLGFVFTDDATSVVLIRKQKPKWQFGLLNGVGGKVEQGESPEQAMSREFFEECGVKVSPHSWRYFAQMGGKYGIVDCFTLRDSEVWQNAVTKESEPVEKIDINELAVSGCMENLFWLVELALDDKVFANIRYYEQL